MAIVAIMALFIMNKDFLIIGAGIVGLTVARSLARRGLGSVCLLEKEKKLGLHSSGRNSGVLHAGIHYPPNTLKAKVCVSGAKRLFEYAVEHGIPVKKAGKVIVATEPGNISQIDVLYERAIANGVRVEKIGPDVLKRIEPEAHTFGQALYSPDTAVIDAKKTLDKLEEEVRSLGVVLDKESQAAGFNVRQKTVRTRQTTYGYGHLINAAGLQADKVAHAMGVGECFHILPFKGIYRRLSAVAAPRFRASIYPVPDLEMPFLGVHITRTIHDEVLLGPTAIPALGRENYGIFKGFDLSEAPAMLRDLASMVARNTDGFAKLVKEELGKYGRAGFLKSARRLAPGLKAQDILPSDKIGIRAQLVDKRRQKLAMDFVIEDGPDSTHILNAISPAFTGSLAFADLVVEKIIGKKALF